MSFYKRTYNKENKKTLDYILGWAKKLKSIEYLGGKCKICGEIKIETLSFHHVDPLQKEFSFASIIHNRWIDIQTELNKCICVCENCHRIIHDNNIDKTRKKYDYRLTNNKKLALEYKNVYSCEKCGYDKNNKCLDFHHIDSDKKVFEMCKILNNNRYKNKNDFSKDIKIELDKCKVLCANCHRSEHFNIEKFNNYKNLIYEKSKNMKEIREKFNKFEILNMYNLGMRPVDIAKHFNTSRGTISEILKSFGIGKFMEDIQISESEILEYHKLGYTNKKIMKILKCSKTTLYKYFKKLDIKCNKECEIYKPPKNINEILEYRSIGKSMREIGEILNISQVSVLKRLKKYENNLNSIIGK